MSKANLGGSNRYIQNSQQNGEWSAQRSIDIAMCQSAFAIASRRLAYIRIHDGVESGQYRSLAQVYYILKNICRDLGLGIKCATEKQRALFVKFIGEDEAKRITERHTAKAVAVSMPLPKRPPGR